MEDGDDDFGDLYADVEVEASSAMNVAPQFSQLQFVSDETGKRNDDLEASSNKKDRVSDGDEDDNDEDDLNIVLNSDVDTIGHVEVSTIARTNTNLRSGELEDEDDDNFGTEEFAGGKAVGNSHSLYKYSRSKSAAYGSDLKGSGCGAAAYLSQEDNGYCIRTMGPQHGQRFSLPWSRSILDVNINVFEQKPWKHPGADITDYFNFGMNEDSWKIYCNQVDEYRHRGPMSSETPASEPAQLIERKGRAIQVEDGIVERQSSMDIRHQLDRDSDVIQITIVDPEVNCCGSEKEGSGNLKSHVPEACNHGGDVSGDDDGTDHLSFSSASEDESFQGNQQLETEIDAPKRVSKRKSSSKPLTQGSENHESHQCSGRTDEAIRTSDNTKERTGEDTCITDPSIFPPESSEAEKSPQNHRKPFKDRWKSSSHERSSFTELTQSMKPENHHSDAHRLHSRRLDDKRKHGDHRYHSRCNNPVYNNSNREDSKPKPKSHHENDDIIWSRRPYEKRKPGEQRYHARRHDNPVYNHRTYERMHHFDPYNEENILYAKDSEPPLDYYHGERFSVYEDYERFGPKMGRPVFRSSEEEEYYGEQRRYTDEFEWQNKRKGSNAHFRNKEINDEFFLQRDYSDDIKGESFRYFAYKDREKDEFEDEYVNHKHLADTRWEFRDPVRKKAELNNHFPKREDQFTEESYTNNGRWHDNNMMPKSSLYEKQWRYDEKLTERCRYDESFGGYSEPFDREDYTIDYDDVARSGDHHWQSEMQWKEDEIIIPFEHDRVEESYDDPYVKGRKYKFERISNVKYEGSHEKRFQRNRNSDITRGGDYEWVFMGGVNSLDSHLVDGCDDVEEMIDDLNADGSGNKRKREVNSGKKFRKSYGESGKKLSLSCRNSLDSRLVVREGKFSKKQNKAAQAIETKAIDQLLDIEEGQILTEKVNTGPTKDNTVAHVNDRNRLHNQIGKAGVDKSRILEARAKMEKRRARFNETITTTTEKESDSTTAKVTVVDLVQERGSNKLQRPARKRRWGGKLKQ